MATKAKPQSPAPDAPAPMSFADAAETLLLKAGTALSHTDLAKQAIAAGLVVTESQTPHISMHVSIRSDMKQRERRGEPQRFVFLGNGLFSLIDVEAGPPTQKAKSALDQIRESRQEAIKELHKRLTLKNNGPGYESVEVIGGKDDQGVDIVCEKRDGVLKTKIAIQCKCKALNLQIGPKDISTLRDNLSTYQCKQGIIVTTTHLNDVAKNKAMESGKEPIHFIEHDELMDLFAEYGIGIRDESVKFFQVDAGKYGFLK
jgi:Restriction endonuclease/HB1, ASXL, restriction endonuclease HTH domain